MALSPSLGDSGRQGSHFVSGGGQKVAVVSRHTRACPLVPPRCPRALLLSAPLPSLATWQKTCTPSSATFGHDSPLFHPPTRRGGFPTSGLSLPHLRGPRPPSLLYPPHPLTVTVILVAVVVVVEAERFLPGCPAIPLSFCLLGRLLHYHRLVFSSTSIGGDPTRVPRRVGRYYHSVLLAIYRPLSTTLPPNGVYRCCLPAWLAGCRDRSRLRSAPGSPQRGVPP